MAYESQTYEVILSRMITRVTNKYPNLDTREGSMIFDALAPAALELAVMYTELDNVRRESFINTASREYILIGCEQMGMDISVFEASAGVHKGVFDVQVPIGSRWNCDLYNFGVTEYLGEENGYHAYRMECETLGTAPNNQTGDLTPITDSPSNLTYAKVTECLIEGENETSDENIRKAYFDYVNSVATDGNVNQYYRWCNEYDGIGNAKVLPLWNGANTVKVSILNTSNRKASDTLIAEFQEYLDPGVTGMGDGIAPIGAFVTVTTAAEVQISVSATVKMKEGFTDTSDIDKALTNYFSQIAYEKSNVSYMTIGAVILGAEGVDYLGNDLAITVDGQNYDGTKDIQLGDEEIPVLSGGKGNWTVIQ